MRRATLSAAALTAILAGASSARAGYTHYFKWLKTPDQTALERCIAEMGRIIDTRLEILADGSGTGSPMVTAREVRFNGKSDSAHEPFVFPGEDGFNFCKTAWKPYDTVVVACLLVARDHFPPDVLDIQSDGQWQEGDWSAGAALYSRVLGRTAHNPMGGPDAVRDWRLPVLIVIAIAFVWYARRRRLR